MSTRTLLNLGLLIAAIALALLAYFKPGVKPGDASRPIITGLAPDQVGSIIVERISRDPLKFSRREGRWYLEAEDRELPAAEFQVRALLRLLDATTSRHYPAASLDLAALGLQPPRARVVMDDVTIQIGNTEALEQRRYVEVGDTVSLIDDQYQHLIDAEWPNFVSRQLLEGRGAVTRLELPGMTLAYGEDGHWRLDPAREGVSADALQTLIENWQNATALLTRRYSGGAAGETITVRTRGSDTPLVFDLVSRKPDIVLARPDWGIQYQFPQSEEENLFTLPRPAPQPAAESAGAPATPPTAEPAAP